MSAAGGWSLDACCVPPESDWRREDFKPNWRGGKEGGYAPIGRDWTEWKEIVVGVVGVSLDFIHSRSE